MVAPNGDTNLQQVSWRNWIAPASFIVGVVGVGLSIFFYLENRATRQLFYAINPVRARIVTRGRPTDLSVSYRNKRIGDTDVTAVQVAVWNGRKLSIRDANVLREIKLALVPSKEILTAAILKVTRNVTDFSLHNSDSNALRGGMLPISWKILEQNDGAIIQIIYLGDSSIDVKVEGIIEGLKPITKIETQEVRSKRTQLDSQDDNQRGSSTLWLYFLFILFFGLPLVSLFRQTFFPRGRTWSMWLKGEGWPSVFLLGILAYTLFLAIMSPPEPPFDF